MSEWEYRLDKIGVCLHCPSGASKKKLSVDHYMPQCMVTRLRTIDKRSPGAHPDLLISAQLLWRELIERPDNKFILCNSHHVNIDIGKIASLVPVQSNPLNDRPDLLIRYLIGQYEITKRPQLTNLHREAIATTHRRFVGFVGASADVFPPALGAHYINAADIANDFIYRLQIDGVQARDVLTLEPVVA